MLFDGALLSISSASSLMKEKKIEAKGNAISRAIDIIGNGLKLSLDKTADPELGDRLEALYDYMMVRLVYANVENDPAALTEVSTLLGELKTAWEEIASDPAVLSFNRSAG
jgi:flagellar protein FliS